MGTEIEFKKECVRCRLHHPGPAEVYAETSQDRCIQEMASRIRDLEEEVYHLRQWKAHSKGSSK